MFKKTFKLFLFSCVISVLLFSSGDLFSQPTVPSLKVLYATPEMYPLVSTGGLGEVAESIPAAIVGLGNEVDVIMPMWSVIDPQTHHIKSMDISVNVEMPWGVVEAKLYEINNRNDDGVRVILVEAPVGSRYFDVPKGQKIYYEAEYEMNIVKFSFFAKAVLEFALMQGTSYYDIIHANDWTTGLIPWYKKYFSKYSALDAKTVYTIHNLGGAFQGTFEQSKLWILQIDPKYLDPTTEGSVVNYDHINFTKAAIGSVDQVATVSAQYGVDIKGEEYGNKLDGILATRDIVGIPHGVDEYRFDPSMNNIKYNFDETTFSGQKGMNKAFVQDKLGLHIIDVPLFISTTRGDVQKNVILLYETLKLMLPKYNMQVVIMGDSYENVDMGDGQNLKQKFEQLERVYKSKLRFMKFDASFHPQLEAAADFQFVISLFEPGGIEPSKAKINKVVCIVHPVNGLTEAVVGENDELGRPQTGIKVYNLNMNVDRAGSISRLVAGIESALSLYENPLNLRRVRENMDGDYSWVPSGKAHLEMYYRVLNMELSPKEVSSLGPNKLQVGKIGPTINKSKVDDRFIAPKGLTEAEVLDFLSFRTSSSVKDLSMQLDALMSVWSEAGAKLTEQDMNLLFGEGTEGYGLYDYLYNLTTDPKDLPENVQFFLTLSGAVAYNAHMKGVFNMPREKIRLVRRAYEGLDVIHLSSADYIKDNIETKPVFKNSAKFESLVKRFDTGFNAIKLIKK